MTAAGYHARPFRFEVFCWCGRKIVHVDQATIDRNETAECGAGCRARYDTRGVVFSEGGRPRIERVPDGPHTLACRCSELCRERRRIYDRQQYRLRAAARATPTSGA